MAARRVADENKKLRILLNQHGVVDDSIDNFLASTPSPETMMSVGYGGMVAGRGMPASSASVQMLEHLLNTRKPCCADGNTGAPGPMGASAAAHTHSHSHSSGDRSTIGSMSTVQSLWDQTYPHLRHKEVAQGHMGGPGQPPQRQFMSPPTTASRTGSVVSTGRGGSMGQPSSHAQAQHQHQHQHQRNRVPSLAPSLSSAASTATTTSQQSQPLYEYDAHAMPHPSYRPSPHLSQPQPPMQQSSHIPRGTPQQQQQQQQQYRPASLIPAGVGPSVGGTYSCVSAADMITTMAGAVAEPHDVRQDLGCMPNGMVDCEVDNQLVFNVMDRYTGRGGGM